ncbi:MAG: cation transporter [Deltaproteobacteria bacterium]|nr:cation transporter [Deltaproteobacteria bacterium]
MAACGYIVVEALGRVQHPSGHHPDGGWVLGIGFAGLLVNLGSAWVLWNSSPDNVNILGAMLHMAADALGSLGAMVAAFFIMAGFPIADAVVSLFIAGLVAFSSIRLVRQLMQVLMEGAPSSVDVVKVKESLAAIDGVQEVHDLHIWSISGDDGVLTAHLVIPDVEKVFPALEIATEILRERFHIGHVTLQPECEGVGCASSTCSLIFSEQNKSSPETAQVHSVEGDVHE